MSNPNSTTRSLVAAYAMPLLTSRSYAHNNAINTLNGSITKFTFLEELHLQNNELKDLNVCLDTLSKLHSLQVTHYTTRMNGVNLVTVITRTRLVTDVEFVR